MPHHQSVRNMPTVAHGAPRFLSQQNVAPEISMTSLELVEVINSKRRPDQAILAHRSFMGKVEKVLGEAAAKFLATDSYINGTGGRVNREIYRLPKRESCLMAMSYSYELQADVFDHMTRLEEAIKVPALPSCSKVVGELAVMECYTRLLKPAPSSQAMMLAKISRNNGLDATFLPAYTVDAAPSSLSGSSMDTGSLTALLKEFNINSSASMFNKRLSVVGYIKQLSRQNSKHQTVYFWSITDKGLEFGKNMTSPSSPRETQPHWYRDRFAELAREVSA